MSIASQNASVLRTRFAQPDALLRFGIGLDGVATGTAAVGLLIAAKWLVEPLGPSLQFQVGHAAALIGYGVLAFALSRADRSRLGTIGVVYIAANLLATVLYVMAGVMTWVPLTTAGVTLCIAFGVYTAVMADIQFLGLRRLRSRSRSHNSPAESEPVPGHPLGGPAPSCSDRCQRQAQRTGCGLGNRRVIRLHWRDAPVCRAQRRAWIGLALVGPERHGALGLCGDGERRVHSQVRRDRRSIADM